MPRIPIAILAGLTGFFAYIAAACILFDALGPLHPVWQALYFLVAGTVWVLPMRWLMYWSVHKT